MPIMLEAVMRVRASRGETNVPWHGNDTKSTLRPPDGVVPWQLLRSFHRPVGYASCPPGPVVCYRNTDRRDHQYPLRRFPDCSASYYLLRRASHPCRYPGFANHLKPFRSVRFSRSDRARDILREQGCRAVAHAQARGCSRPPSQDDDRYPCCLQDEYDVRRCWSKRTARYFGEFEDASCVDAWIAKECEFRTSNIPLPRPSHIRRLVSDKAHRFPLISGRMLRRY